MDSWMYQPTGAEILAGSAPASHVGSPPDHRHLPQRIRRRNRLITSCLECRRRKLKCDKQAPCTNCTRFKRDCLYLASSLDPASQQKLANIKEKMGALERNLEREIAGHQHDRPSSGGGNPYSPVTPIEELNGDDDEDLPHEDEEHLQPYSLLALDNVYNEDADEEFVDLGVQMGKMRISERIGGWIRPRVVDELTDTLQEVRLEELRNSQTPDSSQDQSAPAVSATRVMPPPKSYIGPGPEFVAPSTSFFFPGTNMNTSLIDYLPSKKAADQLIARYFRAVHFLCRCVHRPTFEAAYASFWGQIATGTEPVPSRQAVIFAALFSAAVSMTENQVMQQFGTSKAGLVDSLRCGTEYALSKANLLRTTRFETMQAFVMYLIPQIRGEISRAHSALVGTAIRLAECMGLHRDGTQYNMSPVEVHVRRLVWHQLLFLDLRTCEGTGPRLQIRADDYDTQLPWNVDDSELLDPTLQPSDKPYWTDATFARLRAELVALRRMLWYDMILIDKKKKSLTSTLVKIQKVRTDIAARYMPLIDESYPFQALASVVMSLLIHLNFTQVLHRYMFPPYSHAIPDRLRQVLIESGVGAMETAIELETRPELADWAWYKGAFNQFHIAALLLIEISTYPMRREAPKIWKCLDYIFEIPPGLSPKEKGELVLTDLRDRMEVYHQMRKVRMSAEMEDSLVKARQQNRTTSIDGGTPRQQNATAAIVAATNGSNSYPFLPPINFSPPPARTNSSTGLSSSHGGERNANDMQLMEEIDWTEWEKYFPIESNTGDINIPNFDFANFTGNRATAPLASPQNHQTPHARSQSHSPLDSPPPNHVNYQQQTQPQQQYQGRHTSAPMSNGINSIASGVTQHDLADISFTPAYFASAPSNDPHQQQAPEAALARGQRVAFSGNWMNV